MIANTTFAAIDFESAGVARGENDIPVQVGMAVLEPDGTIDRGKFVRSYIRADRPITWAARKVHGITDDDIADAPSILELWPVFADTLSNRCIVAHSSGTEKRFLRAFPMHGFGPWADTLKIAHAAYPKAPTHALGALTESLGLISELTELCPNLRWHDALYDAVASLLVLREVVEKAELAEAPLETLIHPDRSEYYARRRNR